MYLVSYLPSPYVSSSTWLPAHFCLSLPFPGFPSPRRSHSLPFLALTPTWGMLSLSRSTTLGFPSFTSLPACLGLWHVLLCVVSLSFPSLVFLRCRSVILVPLLLDSEMNGGMLIGPLSASPDTISSYLNMCSSFGTCYIHVALHWVVLSLVLFSVPFFFFLSL